ncbi:Aromatic compound dioxygenase [Mycena venus]|uniref:Aromatic compound dioxygenase n=1 Tax=Mycena venus TaxID=2733690 RepID=A0A8H6XTK9_9AGAR|nr:Aromatic compound dioxygenase [Mycena venus]
MLLVSSTLLAVVSLSGISSAHSHLPAGSIEYNRLETFHKIARRSLASCHDELSRRDGVYERAKQRRQRAANEHRRKRGLPANAPYKRDTSSVLATDHKSNLTGITNNTAAATLFDGNSSCVLAPEVTQGPYLVDGEYVRWDIREDTDGIDTYVDVQLIDIATCKPVPNVYIDFWHANATGVYSGIVANGNGVGTQDASNLNTTFLRGIQATDQDGVAQWLTVFPGHYTGRTPHIHILAHQNATVFNNGTVGSGNASHVGQFFMDQSLISEVETTAPYASNAQTLTTNEEDSILAQEAGTIDPMLEYVLLGDKIADGLMMWAAMGIETSAEYSVSPAAFLTPDGGLVNEDATGGGGAPPGGSGAPGGPGGSVTASGSSVTVSGTVTPSADTNSSADTSPQRYFGLLYSMLAVFLTSVSSVL